MSISGYRVAVVGATGLVGETILQILEERDFPVSEIIPLASENSSGKTIIYKDKTVKVLSLEGFDFEGIDIALFSAGAAISETYAPLAARAGVIVIDNSSIFRNDPDIPLIVPEVNPLAIDGFRERNIIANPNCSTIQMLVAIKPIYDAVGIKRITVSTYQSVSGMGRKAVEALAKQTARLMNGLGVEEDIFAKQMAFNVIPEIDELQENGYTREEMKMVWETQKILQDVSIQVNPTAVRVPVFFGHSESVHIETQQYIDAAMVRELLNNAPGVEVIDSTEELVSASPAINAVGQDQVFVSRIREDLDNNTGINLWIVSDNIRKGAALNAVQIAELLVKTQL
ncbi:MAG: aspartate-semialdehyde dehydrogenase [Gammaproteobacteria bacterium CG22_combo_CG10-13_8_21_14_all_40_8]|nr:MAG: aspartate-semialdehyde dehydrogenase [Gammaproteobacteria bacterium CG22_combo_CG10-13_8_21_14_all_40_8]